MADALHDSRRRGFDEIQDRLEEAARTGRPLALILAVSGKVAPVAGKHGDRWRMRTGRGHVFTFRPEFVIAFEGNGRALRAATRTGGGSRDANDPASPAGQPADG